MIPVYTPPLRDMPIDVEGTTLAIGDKVAVAFRTSYRPYLRVGVLEQMNSPTDFRVRWENGQLSPPMMYDSRRYVKL